MIQVSAGERNSSVKVDGERKISKKFFFQEKAHPVVKPTKRGNESSYESHTGPKQGIPRLAHPRMISAVPCGLLVAKTTSTLCRSTSSGMSFVNWGLPFFRVSHIVTACSNAAFSSSTAYESRRSFKAVVPYVFSILLPKMPMSTGTPGEQDTMKHTSIPRANATGFGGLVVRKWRGRHRWRTQCKHTTRIDRNCTCMAARRIYIGESKDEKVDRRSDLE
jgi:hypothetical protein